MGIEGDKHFVFSGGHLVIYDFNKILDVSDCGIDGVRCCEMGSHCILESVELGDDATLVCLAFKSLPSIMCIHKIFNPLS